MSFDREAAKSLGSTLFDLNASDPARGFDAQRTEKSTTRILTALCMLAACPATVAIAQGGSQAAEPADLPPLVVETIQQRKEKAAATKKSAAPSSPTPQAPAPEPDVADRPQQPPLPGQAGAVAPGEYKADYVMACAIPAAGRGVPDSEERRASQDATERYRDGVLRSDG